ncbi:MAG: hypothetical protein OSJ73_21605 [Lachnospiraceae bacterium]|jgi:hypothetical protein|nr:hypothetical protein [Lachnospiraceae bacterium]
MDVLEEFYNGKLFPSQQIMPEDVTTYRRIAKKTGKERDYLMEILSKEDAKRFKEFDELVFQQSDMIAYANFKYGFQLGSKMMSEILTDKKKTEE